MSRAMSMKNKSASKQHGAIGLMMAVAMLALVLFAALAIDMARLTYQKQALQSVADITALEVSRSNPYFIDGNMSAIENELEAKYQAQDKVTTLEVRSGSAKIEDSQWVFSEQSSSESAPYSAAQVFVTKTVPKSMIAGGLFTDNAVILTALASIQKSGVVRLGIGSELISANLSIVDLGAVGYGGLIKSNIRLTDVISVLPSVDLTTMTPEEVLNTKISASDLLDAYVEVLNLNHNEMGDITLFQGELEVIANLVDGLSSIPNIALGELVELSSTQPFAALSAGINALDLVRATLYAGNKDSGASIPEIDINIPGVASAHSTLDLIEAPQFKVALLPIKEGDEPSVSTEQVDLTSTITLLPGTLDTLTDILDAIPIISNPVEIEISPIRVRVKGAESKATLIGDGTNGNLNLSIQQSLGKVFIDDFTVKVTVKVGVLGIGLLNVPIDIILTQRGINGEVAALDLSAQEINIPINMKTLPLEEVVYAKDINIKSNLRVSSSKPNFDGIGSLVVGLVQGLVLPLVLPLVNTLISVLPSLLSPIINDVIVQSLSNLGVNLGTTTVWVDAAGTTQYGLIK